MGGSVGEEEEPDSKRQRSVWMAAHVLLLRRHFQLALGAQREFIESCHGPLLCHSASKLY